MSPREHVADLIGEWLIIHREIFNAPYGVIPGLQTTSRGKLRTIAFGIARTLDATIEIWAPTVIRIRARGPAEHQFDGKTFESAQDCIDFLQSTITEYYWMI